MPIFRGCGERRHFADAGDRHLERARNRRRAHREDVDVGLEFLQLVFVLDTETLLLVDDDEPEVFDDDVRREQTVGSDDDVDRAIREPLERLLRLLVALKTAEGAEVHGEPGEAFGEGLDVLPHKQGGGHQHHDLFAVLHRLERGAHRNLGFAVADVARDETVHRDGPLHVGFDLVDGGELVDRFDERKRLLQLALPRSVGRESVPSTRHPGGVQLDQFDRDVAHCFARLAFRRRPVAAAHLAQRRRFTPHVASQQVELVGGHEELVARISAFRWRVLDHQVFAAHFRLRDCTRTARAR